jgi:hypothetical protein
VCNSFETLRKLCGGISVTHPAHAFIAKPFEQIGMIVEVDSRPSVLLRGWALDLSSEQFNHELEPIADPEYRNAETEYLLLASWRVWIIHACGPA